MRHMIDLFANSEATLMANVFEVRNFDSKHQWRRKGDETGGGGEQTSKARDFCWCLGACSSRTFLFLGSLKRYF